MRGLALAGIVPAVLGPYAYLEGLWPQHLEVTVDGPESWNLVRVGEDACDEPLPADVADFVGLGARGGMVHSTLEVSDGRLRALGRVRALDWGCYLSGHMALLRGAESLDGSLWLLDGRTVTVRPAVPGQLWFGCELWDETSIRCDGTAFARRRSHAIAIQATGDVAHVVESDDWNLNFVADAGTVVHLSEWGSPFGTVLRCGDSGYATGTLALDGGLARPVDLGEPIALDALELDLCLEAPDGGRAKVRLLRPTTLQITLRVSR